MNNKKMFKELIEEKKENARVMKNKLVGIELKKYFSLFWTHNNFIHEFSKFVGYNVESIDDLLAFDKDVFKRFFESVFYYDEDDENVLKSLNSLKLFLQFDGFVLDGEYEDLGLEKEALTICLDDLKGFPEDVLEEFKYRKFLFLGDILSLDYTSDYAIEVFGKKGIKELKKYLNSIGINIDDKNDLINKKKEEYRKQGLRLLEDVIDDQKLCFDLYNNYIFTVEELNDSKNEVINFNLNGFSKKSFEKLMTYSEKLGIDFSKENITLDTEIKNIKGLSFAKYYLMNYGIYTLNDLLNYEYKDLLNISGLGEVSILEIKNYVHSIGYNLKNEYELRIEIKDRLIKEDKKLIDEYISSKILCKRLNDEGIYTLDELIKNGVNVFNINDLTYKNKYDLLNLFNKLGVDIKLEENLKKEINQDNVDRSILLADIAKFPSKFIRKLYWNGIHTLGDLLDADFNDICKTRHVGEAGAIEIKEYVHSLGYTLKGEYEFVSEKVKKLREKNIELLEDVFKETTICGFLYRNDIFTVEDLVNSYEKVLSIGNFGPKRKEQLYELMKKNNIKFNNNSNTDILFNEVVHEKKEEKSLEEEFDYSNVDEYKEVEEEFDYSEVVEYKEVEEFDYVGIEEKKEEKVTRLFNELYSLLDERRELKLREKELDRLIDEKLKEVNDVVTYVK